MPRSSPFFTLASLFLLAILASCWGCERRMNPVGPTKLRGRIVFEAVYIFVPQIFTIYPDEPGEPVLLTNNSRSDNILPKWSPDGTRIAFLSNRNLAPNFYRLYVMDADGSNVTGLFDPLRHPEGDLEFAWAPDGRHIALVNRVSGSSTNRRQLYIVDVTTLERRLVATALPNRFSPDWSPDGTRIAFTSSNPNSLVATLQILSYPNLAIQTIDVGMTTPNFPRWSPDGQSLAFIASPTGPPLLYQIYIADFRALSPGSGTISSVPVHQVTHISAGVSNRSPLTWSPDGQRIVFSARGTYPFDPTSRDLYSINIDGTQLVRLTTNPTDELAPDWTSHD